MWHIGPHIINNKPDINLLAKWNPSSITLLDGDKNYMREIRNRLPNTHINLRIYFPDSEISDKIKENAANAAHYYHNQTLAKYGDILHSGIISTIQIENEVLQHGDDLKRLNEFALTHMRYANDNGYKVCNFAFSVGNPDIPNWSLLTDSLKYAEDTNHIVGIHQYGKPPTFWTVDPDWHIHRLEHKVLPILPFTKLKFLVCEYGLDNLLYGNGNPGGYKHFINTDEYVNQIINISEYTIRFTNRIIGYNLFTFGHNAPWESYDIDGQVAERLAEYGRTFVNNSNNNLNVDNNNTNNTYVPIVFTDTKVKYTTFSTAKPHLNLRSEPNTTSNIINKITPFTPIGIIESGEWAKVVYNNTYGFANSKYFINAGEQYLYEYSLKYNLDFLLLLSILKIESNSAAFRPDGELTMRFELHIFKQFYAIDDNRKAEFVKNFIIRGNNHYVYINGQEIEYHSQGKELEALNIAKSLDESAALQSTSFGIPQIMGFNYRIGGFVNVLQLVDYLKADELNHYKIFIAYLEQRGIIQYIKSYDYNKIAELYNGKGNIPVYSKLIQNKYNELKG